MRTKNLEDFIPADGIDLVFGGETAYPNDSFCLSRSSKDSSLNRFGSSLIDLCCLHEIHIMFNGRLFGDTEGNFTCTANDGNSVVDYCLGSTSLISHVTDFYVGVEDFSDHFPLCCKLAFDKCQQNDIDRNAHNAFIYKWKDSCKDDFIRQFCQLFTEFSSSLTEANIVAKLNDFTHIFKQAGVSMKKRRSNRAQPPVVQPEWWDNECEVAKYVKYRSLREFRVTNHRDDYELYLSQNKGIQKYVFSKETLARKATPR